MGWVWLAVALAGEPTVEVQGTDTVVGRVSVPMAPEAVRVKLADPVWVAQVSKGGTTAVVTGKQGACLDVDYTSPSPFLTVRYQVKQCPAKDGYVGELVSSNAFKTYSTSWRVTPAATGSTLEYKVQLVTSLFVPNSLVTSSTRKGVVNLLTNLSASLGAP